MLEKIRIIFSIPELRKKILLTLLLLLVFRVGSMIHLPVVDQSRMTAYAENMKKGDLGALLNTVAIFSASDISQATIFGLGIMPYISA
jgi:preprotein translocase subunit SecY